MKQVLILGDVSFNTMIYLDTFPEPELTQSSAKACTKPLEAPPLARR